MGLRPSSPVLACVLAVATLAPGCRASLVGRVRLPDGRIETRRLDAEQSIVMRRAAVDLSCALDRLVVERVAGTTQFMVRGCARESAYVCARLPRIGVLCELEYVRGDTRGAEAAMLPPVIAAGGTAPTFAPPQSIVAIEPAAPPDAAPEAAAGAPRGGAGPTPRGRARDELANPRTGRVER